MADPGLPTRCPALEIDLAGRRPGCHRGRPGRTSPTGRPAASCEPRRRVRRPNRRIWLDQRDRTADAATRTPRSRVVASVQATRGSTATADAANAAVRLDGARQALRGRGRSARREAPGGAGRPPAWSPRRRRRPRDRATASSSRCSARRARGKTTTLRMIAGFELPTEGRIRLHGGDVTEPAAVRARREHGLPGLRPVPAHDRRRQRRLRADGPEGRRGRSGSGGSPRRSQMVRLAGYETRASQRSSRAASASGSRSRARS